MLTITESDGLNRAEAPLVSELPAPSVATLKVDTRKHSRGLVLIGLFKLSKFIFFAAVGLGALHLVHSNIGDLFLTIASKLHLSLDGPLMGRLEDRADLISGHELRQVSLLTCGYAILSLIEGTGLMLEKTWAEYLTLTLTICGLPWEVWELMKGATTMRLAVFFSNLAVLAYLLWFLKRKKQKKLALLAAL